MISPVLWGSLLILFWYCNCYSVFIQMLATSLQSRIFMPRGIWYFASLEANYQNNVELLDIDGTDLDSPWILMKYFKQYWSCSLTMLSLWWYQNKSYILIYYSKFGPFCLSSSEIYFFIAKLLRKPILFNFSHRDWAKVVLPWQDRIKIFCRGDTD